MGMFDEVFINSEKLPISDIDKEKLKGHNFQTKDFDCYLEHYYITDNGNLEFEQCDYIDTPPEERPYPDPNNKFHFLGSMTPKNFRRINKHFHGVFRFYTGIEGEWFEFKAKFTDGKLVEITRVEQI